MFNGTEKHLVSWKEEHISDVKQMQLGSVRIEWTRDSSHSFQNVQILSLSFGHPLDLWTLILHYNA